MSNTIQLFDIIEEILRQIGKAEIHISTFSTSEEFLRRIYRLKRNGLIGKATLLADLKAARKTVNLYTLISNVFDEAYLSENHSKVILMRNEKWMVSIITSQNQTRGNRTESGIITTDQSVFLDVEAQFIDILKYKSIKLNGLFIETIG